ncbi:hypothetical protein FA95DRAFT_1506901 [Auriscalpium vulgare]|uniref:Uncharacterized protein n=1 Tax=Auriscalpium vulgare TaxID=40419 RepID=A0ACB8R138_9AGAM|nr:hypothetical protein FA95DRAFT_1506901 [Auriscalpium vulgare]
MDILNPCAALLSNFEVLALLRQLESQHLARSKSAFRVKKEDEAAGVPLPAAADQLDAVSENLRTLEVEAIQYLAADYQPSSRQTSAAITQLVKDLAPFGLNKSEKLQITNLAPTEAVELYVIVEELEDRLGERMEDVLSAVRSSLVDPPLDDPVYGSAPDFLDETAGFFVDSAAHQEWTGGEDVEFDDVGEGVGVEGDLDVEDD